MKLSLIALVCLFSPFTFALHLECQSAEDHAFIFNRYATRVIDGKIAFARTTAGPLLFSGSQLELISEDIGFSGTKTVYKDARIGTLLTLASSRTISENNFCGRGGCPEPPPVTKIYSAIVENNNETPIHFICQ
jgi:hypothetical protein